MPTSEIEVKQTLYAPGTKLYHRPSGCCDIITQDPQNSKVYYLTTLVNPATPEQNNTTKRIQGSRNDGLLEHELVYQAGICFAETSIDGWKNIINRE